MQRPLSDSIFNTLNKLRQLTQVDVIQNWQYYSTDSPSPPVNFGDWEIATPNEKGYLIFDAGKEVRWFVQRFIIPNNLQGYSISGSTLRLALTWWADSAQIFVNGKLVQEGDLFDSSARILLAEKASSGQEIVVAIRLVSPGHDIGAIMRSRLIYEATNSSISNSINPGFIADELSTLHKYLEAFEPNKLETVATQLAELETNFLQDSHPFLMGAGGDQQSDFNSYLFNLSQSLSPLAKNIQQRTMKMLGHAHLDMAWLWEISETWDVAQRTFTSVLNLQKDFPELTFCHTSPALYAWVEKHRPDLFTAIQEAVRAGKWEVLGGMWVEPEVNLISGESLVRQLLYGQRYFQEKFGSISKICWLTDSFGFPWQLPQILKQCGIEYFVTQKLHWNDTTEFPYGAFMWESPDGSKIFSIMSPPNVTGVMDTNPITMTNYAVKWEQQTGLRNIFWLPGVGDHGGGPTRDMLEVQQCWKKSDFFPKLEFTTAEDYLSEIEGELEKGDINCWKNELYLELHRGCYTTHADQKYWNRYCEGLLYSAELFASIATLALGVSYPKAKLETAWKSVLFNQFHDILPGTSIPEVFVEANKTWEVAGKIGSTILEESLNAIASSINLSHSTQNNAQPIIIFNSLNWTRSEIVELKLDSVTPNTVIYDLEGNMIPTQVTRDNTLLFLAKDIPSIGYRVFWLGVKEKQGLTPYHTISEEGKHIGIAPTFSPLFKGGKGGIKMGMKEGSNLTSLNYILENSYLRVTINPKTGDLSSVYDKILQRKILKGEGNVLQAFQDKGQYWDAWNIDPNYEQHPLPPTQLKLTQWREWGELRQSIQVIRELGDSIFTQDYILEKDSPLLKIATTVDWREDHVMVKAAFPLNLEADVANYEIACGTISRTTKPASPAEKAKWEVYAHRWADLTDNSEKYGVSLLNDCKYGYDSKPDQLRLTLLRSPKWPDENADRGIHSFSYALYSHGKTWKEAKTVQKGYEFNLPLQVYSDVSVNDESSQLPPVNSFLSLDADNLILMAFKQSEDDANTWIVRCYECQGEKANFLLQCDAFGETNQIQPVNCLEQPQERVNTLSVQPWQIVTFSALK